MSTTIEQECPFCQRKAVFTAMDFGRRKHFFCGHCNEFVITNMAENRLKQAPAEWKAQMSCMAQRSNDEKVFVVQMNSRPKEQGVANQAFDARLISRSSVSE